MLKTWQYWLVTVIGAAALVLAGINIVVFHLNREAQASVNARAQYLQQTGPIRELYQEMAKALAELSIKNHDDVVASMLSSEGIRINPPAAPEASSAKSGGKP